MAKVAYKIGETYFYGHTEAVECCRVQGKILSDIKKIELEPWQKIIDGHLVTLAEEPTPPGINYKVCIGLETEIPFWENFEGAKACTLAINTNKHGNRARLISFVPESEVKL